MEITFKNRNKINDLYIHDSNYTGFVHDYKKRQITLSCDNYYLKKKFHFTFNNVISCNLQSCLFWSKNGHHILDIYQEENSSQLEQLLVIQSSNPDFCYSALDQEKQFFEVGFEINSGDTLNIISESVIYTEEELDEEPIN